MSAIAEPPSVLDNAAKASEPADSSRRPAVSGALASPDVTVRVVLGGSTIRVQDLLKLAVGSVVVLDTGPSDPVEVRVHDVVVAHGTVVPMDAGFGVKVRDVISAQDRLATRLTGRRSVLASVGRESLT